MTLRRTIVSIIIFFIPIFAIAKKDKPYEWPAMPKKADVLKPMHYNSRTGLIVLKREVNLQIDRVTGETREEFIRILVQNEKGVHNATADVSGRRGSTLDVVEARTVKPDGTILKADKEKDIHLVKVGNLKKKTQQPAMAKINFPGVVKGSILDLHFIIKHNGISIFWISQVTYGDSPSLETKYKMRVNVGFPGTHWSVNLLGGRAGMGKLSKGGSHVINASFGPLVPHEEEPDSTPFYQRETTLLLYINFDNKTYNAGKRASRSFRTDPRGRLKNFSWKGVSLEDWWHDYFKQSLDQSNKFIKHHGKAGAETVNSIAPVSLPLKERLKRLYEYTQQQIKYNPDAENVDDLKDLVKKGQNSSWQGTLYFYYLLKSAGIKCRDVFIADRHSIRFTPFIANRYIYGFADAVMVDVPGEGKQFFMPGNLGLPFGSISSEYQDSLAFWVSKDKNDDDIGFSYTPLDKPGVDKAEYKFEAELDTNGELTGKLDLHETGAPAEPFLNWYRYRQFRIRNPKKHSKKKRLSNQERQDQLDKHLRWETEVPGKGLDFTGHKLKTLPEKSSEPLEITCSFTSKNTAKKVQGDQWLIDVFPTMAGYTSPFTEAHRETPIWYDDGGKLIIEGTIKLPAGAKLLDIPQPSVFNGPIKTQLKTSVEKIEKDGATAVHVRMEYDKPLIIGYDKYMAWKTYLTFLAKAASTRILISMPEAEEFE